MLAMSSSAAARLLALFSTLAAGLAWRAFRPGAPAFVVPLLGAALGLGFATKGPIALVIPGIAVLLLLYENRTRPLPCGIGALALGAFACAALGLGWFALVFPALLLNYLGQAALLVITLGFLYPVIRYLQRMGATLGTSDTAFTIRRMLLGACLGGVPLLATWASIQWASVWADQLAERLGPPPDQGVF